MHVVNVACVPLHVVNVACVPLHVMNVACVSSSVLLLIRCVACLECYFCVFACLVADCRVVLMVEVYPGSTLLYKVLTDY